MRPTRRQWLAAAVASGCVHCTILVAATAPHDTESLARAAGGQTTVGIVSAASRFQDGEIEVDAVETADTLESPPTERIVPPVVEAVDVARAAQTVPATAAPPTVSQVTAARMLAPVETVRRAPVSAPDPSPVRTAAAVPAEAPARPARVLEAVPALKPAETGTPALEPVETAARVVEEAARPRPPQAVRPRPRPSRNEAKRPRPRRSVAARASHGGGGTGGQSRSVAGRAALTNYLGVVSARLHRQKRYPRSARSRRLEGTAVISFTIDADGRVVRSRLSRGSGHALLDREVRAMLDRAAPFPPIPASLGRRTVSLSVPVRFAVR